LSNRVEFAGMVHDVAPYYRRCNVVVHASIEPEPFGMVIIEAMAEGRPVVASVVGAGAEIVLNSECGVVADPRDPKDLAEKVCMLLTDGTRAQEMGLRGFSEVKQHYEPRMVARTFENLYRSLL
jgi:glycosyltransferase involved in cell wall biosynthesis